MAQELPLFVDLVRRDDRQGTSAVVSVAVGGLAALSVAGVLAAPALGWAIAALSGAASLLLPAGAYLPHHLPFFAMG